MYEIGLLMFDLYRGKEHSYWGYWWVRPYSILLIGFSGNTHLCHTVISLMVGHGKHLSMQYRMFLMSICGKYSSMSYSIVLIGRL